MSLSDSSMDTNEGSERQSQASAGSRLELSPVSEYLNKSEDKSADSSDDKLPRYSVQDLLPFKTSLNFAKSSIVSLKKEVEKFTKGGSCPPGFAQIGKSIEEISTRLARLSTPKGNLVLPVRNPCGCSKVSALGRDLATQTATSSADAGTDMELVPNWWEGDWVAEARAAARGHRTPVTRKKGPPTRTATAETEADSAMETENENWATVARKNPRPKKRATEEPRQPLPPATARPQVRSYPKRPPAVLIRPAAGKSYADTIRLVRSCGLSMGELGTRLVMRETRDGSLLMELPKGEKASAAAKKVASAFSSRLGEDVGRISQLGVLVDVEVLDLDACATEAEVLEALRGAVPGQEDDTRRLDQESISDVRIGSIRSNQQIASAKMPKHLAVKISKIPVGYSMCRVRPRTLPPERCFRCQAFGHNARKCTAETDRTGACWRCGQPGHGLKDCKESEDNCLACQLVGLPRVSHKPGSGACAARKQAARPTPPPAHS